MKVCFHPPTGEKMYLHIPSDSAQVRAALKNLKHYQKDKDQWLSQEKQNKGTHIRSRSV